MLPSPDLSEFATLVAVQGFAEQTYDATHIFHLWEFRDIKTENYIYLLKDHEFKCIEICKKLHVFLYSQNSIHLGGSQIKSIHLDL